MRTHRLIAAAILLLSLLFGLIPSAFASQPEFSITVLDITFPIDGCAFPAESHLIATIKASVHYDQNGDYKVLIERTLDQSTSYTNLETGYSLSSTRGGGIDKILIDEDGTVLFIFTGLVDIVPIPGQGLVVRDVGRFIVDTETGEILFSAGKFTIHGPGGSLEALCEALA